MEGQSPRSWFQGKEKPLKGFVWDSDMIKVEL